MLPNYPDLIKNVSGPSLNYLPVFFHGPKVGDYTEKDSIVNVGATQDLFQPAERHRLPPEGGAGEDGRDHKQVPGQGNKQTQTTQCGCCSHVDMEFLHI